MLKPVALANAAAIIFVVAYTLCGIVSYILPDLYWGILNSWMHGINLEVAKATDSMSIGTFIFGVITFTAYVWIISFLGSSLYNKFAK